MQCPWVTTCRVCGQPNSGWVYDSDLGPVHAPEILYGNGIWESNTRTDYKHDGAGKLVNCADSDSRIHTYGDNFIHCDQVNGGETWQEILGTGIFLEPYFKGDHSPIGNQCTAWSMIYVVINWLNP